MAKTVAVHLFAVSLTAITAFSTNSCMTSAKEKSEAAAGDIQTTNVALPDGRGLACAIYAPNSDIGTIDCDWSHASKNITADPDTKIAVKVVSSATGPVLCAIYAPNWSVGSITCNWATT